MPTILTVVFVAFVKFTGAFIVIFNPITPTEIFPAPAAPAASCAVIFHFPNVMFPLLPQLGHNDLSGPSAVFTVTFRTSKVADKSPAPVCCKISLTLVISVTFM